jgi:hypothetical protein
MARPPKPLTIIEGPPKPPHGWGPHNARVHAEAVARAIAHEEHCQRSRANRGFKSLRKNRRPAKVPFGNLPERDRPAAEREFARLELAYVARHGHPPPRMKRMSMMGNASWIVKYCHSGKRKSWLARAISYRGFLARLDRQKPPAEGQPATAKAPRATAAATRPPVRPPARSSWRGLQGV